MKNPIIAALDGFRSSSEALAHAERLAPSVTGFKVNDLLDTCGAQIVRDLTSLGRLVMADAKIHDIPKTTANRVAVYSHCKTGAGADFVTVHASAGLEALMAAVRAHGYEVDENVVAAITVLTSLDEEECSQVYGQPVRAKVLQFARWAAYARCRAMVCSGQELDFLNRHARTDERLKKLIRIVPGISPEWFQAKTPDQKRTITPKEALARGADYLVIGRAIFETGDPFENVQRILDEIGYRPSEDETRRRGSMGDSA